MTFEQLVPIAKAAVVAYPALTVPQLLALWWVESRWDPTVVNSASLATGLGQVMPQEAGFNDRPTIEELKDPTVNAEWSARILAGNLARANGDLRQAVKWYSGGWASSGDEAFEATYWQPFLKKLGEMTKLYYKDGATMTDEEVQAAAKWHAEEAVRQIEAAIKMLQEARRRLLDQTIYLLGD